MDVDRENTRDSETGSCLSIRRRCESLPLLPASPFPGLSRRNSGERTGRCTRGSPAALGLQLDDVRPARRRSFASRTALRFTIGGLLFVLVGVALPLKLFTGTDELHTAIRGARAFCAGLLIWTVFAKILTFALCVGFA